MAVCGWSVTKCGCGSCWETFTPAVRTQAETLATSFLWTATGRQFGGCPITVLPINVVPLTPLYQTYPTRHRLGPGGYSGYGGPSYGDADAGGGLIQPYMYGGQWFNGCFGGCTCVNSRCQVDLAATVRDIVEVTVAGVAIDPTTYRVIDRHLLVRLGAECWPVCQQLNAEVPGFTVTYNPGLPIPDAVQLAAELLACEYGKFCMGGACRLPPRLTHLARQGLDVTLAEGPTVQRFPGHPTQLVTGIALVDDVVAEYNPFGRTAPLQVLSPDLPAPRVITWQAGS